MKKTSFHRTIDIGTAEKRQTGGEPRGGRRLGKPSPQPSSRASGDAQTRTWAQLAAISGVVAAGSYFLFSAVDLPLRAGLVLVCAFGPPLAAFSAGVYAICVSIAPR